MLARYRLSSWLNAMQSTAQSGSISYKFSDMASSITARVAVVPIFAGTTINGFLSDHTSGTYPACDLVPVPLVPAQELVKELWRVLVPAHLWRQNNDLSFQLAVLGGHMRLVETFVEAMLQRASVDAAELDSWHALVSASQGCAWNLADVVSDAVASTGSIFAERYSTWLTTSRPQLVAAAVLGVPLPTGDTFTLDDCSVDSIVQNCPVAVSKGVDGCVRLSLSTLTLVRLCARSHGPLETAVYRLFQSICSCRLRVGFEAFESLCAQRLAVQILAAEYFQVKLTLEDVFPGAKFSSNACQMLRFDSNERSSDESPARAVDVVEAASQFPGSPIVDRKTGRPVPWDRPVVVVNAASAPFADLAARLASGVTLLCQVKRYFRSGVEVEGGKDSIVSEVAKMDAALREEGGRWWFGEDEPVAALYLSLGYGAGGKRLSEGDRSDALEEDLTSADLALPTAVVFRGGGFEEVFGVLADSVALKADECVLSPAVSTRSRGVAVLCTRMERAH